MVVVAPNFPYLIFWSKYVTKQNFIKIGSRMYTFLLIKKCAAGFSNPRMRLKNLVGLNTPYLAWKLSWGLRVGSPTKIFNFDLEAHLWDTPGGHLGGSKIVNFFLKIWIFFDKFGLRKVSSDS